MAKRLTDSEKWEDPWFCDLSPNAKVLFLFLCDNCDLAGFYERHDRMTSFYTAIKQDDLEKTYQELSKSVVVRDRWVFVKNFIRHQKNLPLNPANGAHRSIIRSLVSKCDFFGDLYIGLLGFSSEEVRGLLGGSKLQVRGLGIDIDKGIGKGNDLKETKIKFFNQLDAFNSIAKRYPKQIGSSAAMRFFFQTVLDEEKFSLFKRAFENYLSSSRVKEGYAKDFDKWIVDWSDWIDYKEPKKLTDEQKKVRQMRDEALGVK